MKRARLILTVPAIKAAYDYLDETAPFVGWNLPDSDSITFGIASDRTLFGWYTAEGRRPRRRYGIWISKFNVVQTETLIATMAHEMLHIHQDQTGQSKRSNEHNRAFHRDAELICAIHGFDPGRFW